MRSLVCVCLVASGSSGLVETSPDSTDSAGLVRARPSRPSRPSRLSRPASSGIVRHRPASSGIVRHRPSRPASSGLVRLVRLVRLVWPRPALTPGSRPARRLIQLIWLTQTKPTQGRTHTSFEIATTAEHALHPLDYDSHSRST